MDIKPIIPPVKNPPPIGYTITLNVEEAKMLAALIGELSFGSMHNMQKSANFKKLNLRPEKYEEFTFILYNELNNHVELSPLMCF
jgi:hypothetical protein